jgi:7-cyano-7-deazaguanine reductase
MSLLSPSDSSYEGRQDHIPALETPEIETWAFQFPNSRTVLEINTSEFTCVCPKTGLPDFATLEIRYRPQAHCLELKSFKEYLLYYRNQGIFHEHVVNLLLRDLVKACKPAWMEIRGIFNARGGITTTAIATYGDVQP